MEKCRVCRSIYDSIEKIITIYIPGIITLILGVIITVEVLSRQIFNHSFMGIVDIVEQGVMLLVFLSIAGIQTTRSHITIDLLPEKLKHRRSGPILDCALLVGSILAVGFLLAEMAVYSCDIHKMNLRTLVLFLPILPFAIGAIIGILLLFISLILQFKESLFRARSFKHVGIDRSESDPNQQS